MKEPPITKGDGIKTQKEFYFILYFEFEYRKCRTIKGCIINLLKCATKCSISYTYILSYSAKIVSTSLFTLAVLPGAVVPWLKYGSAAPGKTTRVTKDVTKDVCIRLST